VYWIPTNSYTGVVHINNTHAAGNGRWRHDQYHLPIFVVPTAAVERSAVQRRPSLNAKTGFRRPGQPQYVAFEPHRAGAIRHQRSLDFQAVRSHFAGRQAHTPGGVSSSVVNVIWSRRSSQAAWDDSGGL